MPVDDDFDAMDEKEYGEFVPAVFARNEEDAEKYREILEDHDIPVVLSDETGPQDPDEEEPAVPRRNMTRGVAVMVPDALLDEASEIIADREDTEEFEEDDELFDDEEEDEFDLDEEFTEEDLGFDEEDDEEELFGDLGDEDDEDELEDEEEL
ncbi:MAG: hypothetical protein ACLFV7_04740 [Phycisphaerae bacterium]